MQPALRSPIPDASLAVFPVNGENSHQGFAGRNPAPHPVREACKFAVLLGLRGQAELNRIRSRYTGKERDAESGLDYFGARMYASTMGRFMSPDDFGGHLEDPQTLNKYAYAGNNPLRYTDPSGHDFWQSCSTAGKSCGNQQIGTGTDGKPINQLVSGTTGANGKFTATVITSASLGQAGSGNTASVDGTGVHITTGTGTDSQQTGQGIFISGTQAADIQGSGTGWNQFNFHIDGNDVAHGGLSSGTARISDQGTRRHGRCDQQHDVGRQYRAVPLSRRG
jgi:RHS repeat-associated protein